MMRASCRGMTLVEIVVALGVFAIALTGLMSALSMSTSLDTVSRERTHALNTAMTEMETALAEPFDDLVTNQHNRAFDVNMELSNGTIVMPPGSGLANSGVVTVTAFGGNADVLLVEVRVRWRSAINQDQEISLKSLKSKTAAGP